MAVRMKKDTELSVVFLGETEALLPPNKELQDQCASAFPRAWVTCVPTVSMFFKNRGLRYVLGLSDHGCTSGF